MTAKDIGADHVDRVEEALPPIEALMYHEKVHLNEEAVDEIQADRSAGSLGDGFDVKRDRRLLWKIDFRLIPMLAIIYGICVIDRYPVFCAMLFTVVLIWGMLRLPGWMLTLGLVSAPDIRFVCSSSSRLI